MFFLYFSLSLLLSLSLSVPPPHHHHHHPSTSLSISLCVCNRPGDSSAPGEGEDPGVHAVTPRPGPQGGLLRRSLHRQAGPRVGRHHRLQRQLQRPGQWEARVEEVCRRATPHVLVCERQVRKPRPLCQWHRRVIEVWLIPHQQCNCCWCCCHVYPCCLLPGLVQ